MQSHLKANMWIKFWIVILSNLFIFYAAQTFAQTIENSELEEQTITNEELENMFAERERIQELEAYQERQRVIARRLRVRFGFEIGFTQALALNIASPELYEDLTLSGISLVSGAAIGMLSTRILIREGSTAQVRIARIAHRIGTILAAQFYWFQQSISCQRGISCDENPGTFGTMLSFTSLASAVVGVSIAKNYPNIREEQTLRYQHGMYWGIISGILLGMPTYERANYSVKASSMTLISTFGGLAGGFYLNKMDLFTAHEIVVMSELGMLGCFLAISLAGPLNNNRAIYGFIGGGFGMVFGHSLVHNNPNTSFGRRLNSLVVAPNYFEHGQGHRVSGLTISGSF